jgi:hypothetical protein
MKVQDGWVMKEIISRRYWLFDDDIDGLLIGRKREAAGWYWLFTGVDRNRHTSGLS